VNFTFRVLLRPPLRPREVGGEAAVDSDAIR
jgi:hypothetical protein